MLLLISAGKQTKREIAPHPILSHRAQYIFQRALLRGSSSLSWRVLLFGKPFQGVAKNNWHALCYYQENCTVLGDNDRHHPIMSRIYNVVIDRSRDTARCKTRLQPGAQVVAAYGKYDPHGRCSR